MIIQILGSAAGGGFPQWNCNCANCAAARAGRPNIVARTQTSIAVSADGSDWILLDATPDLRSQIAATKALQPHPKDPPRSSPIKAVVVTGFEIDQVSGLLNLREDQGFRLHATAFVLAALRANAIFNVLAPPAVVRREMQMWQPFSPDGGGSIEITALPVPGKGFLHSTGDDLEPHRDGTIGLVIRDVTRGTRAAYIPSCAAITDTVLRAIDGVDSLLFDGTLYTDRELIDQRLSHKTGAMMGHIAMSGPAGAIASLRHITIGRRIFIHLNNSNPVLRDDSPERRAVREADWDIACDGMELII